MSTDMLHDGIALHIPESTDSAVLRGLCDVSIEGFQSEMAPHSFLEQRGAAHRDRMPKLANALAHIALHNGPAVIVIRLGEETVQNAGPTPQEYGGPGIKNLNPADPWHIVLNGIAGLHGFGYSTLQDGALITSVMPVKMIEGVKGHSGNATEDLGLHTEAASARTATVDLTPDVLTLQFIRNTERIPTTISIPDFSALDRRVIEILSRPTSRILTNPAQGGENNDPDALVPIVYKHSRAQNQFMFGLTTTRMDLSGKSPEGQEAIGIFLEHLESQRYNGLVLEPGDVVFIDNRRAAHDCYIGAEAVSLRYDGTDRYQRRLCTTSDLGRFRGYTLASDSRVVDLSRLNSVKRERSDKRGSII